MSSSKSDHNSFVLYADNPIFSNEKLLSNEQLGELVRALATYVLTGEETICEGTELYPVWSFVIDTQRRNEEKYAKRCENSAKAAKKLWDNKNANASDRMQADANDANACDRMQADANDAYTDTDTGTGTGTDIKEREGAKAPASKRFVKPTVDDVKAYIEQQGYTFDANQFVDFYESKGWMVGKNKMKDWKASCRAWQQREKPKKDTSWAKAYDKF